MKPQNGIKRIIYGVLGFLFLACSFVRGQSVSIFYDGLEGKSEAFKSACFLHRLLGHFKIEQSTVISIRHYLAGQALQPDFLFLVFEEGQPEFPPFFLDDLGQREKSTLWINMHVDRFLEKKGEELGLAYDDWEEREDWQIFYQNEDFPKEDPGLNRVAIQAPERVEILATISSPDGRVYPYVLKSGHFWYIADSPFSYAYEGGRFLILADFLHDFLGQDHAVSRQALLRLEDVNPEDDPENLRRVGRWLEKEGIPFAISLIPIFREPSTQQEIRLSERPKLVATLKELVSRGGTIFLHGATHQHLGRTAEDYEFWDDIVGQPIAHETDDWVEERVRLGLEECLRCGLYPLAWETPHYSASQEDYRLISRFFDSFYDRVMAAELVGTQQIFPYPVFLPGLKIQVIPENLGYIDLEKPDPRALLDKARNMLVVRDGLASFFFHSFVPVRYLQEVCRGMKAMGWQFISLRDFPCHVRTDSLWVTSAGGEGYIQLRGEYLHELILDRKGKKLKESYSPQPIDGVWPQKIELPRGFLYVLEAVPYLPPKSTNSAVRFLGKIKELIARDTEVSPLRLTTTAVVTSEGLNPEEKNNMKSFFSTLQVFGLNPEEIPLSKINQLKPGTPDLLVIPHGVALELSLRSINRVLDFIYQGGMVITDGYSPLAERIGFTFMPEEIKVRGIKETTLPAPIFTWSSPASVAKFAFEEGLVLARDVEQNLPLVVLRSLGQGKVLFLAATFDPETPFGVSRFPYLAYYLKNNMGIPFHVRRNNLEVYFDPGLRPEASLEKLVRHWRSSGIKIIYLAAWHFYENYQFPYRYFIDLCHRFGIAVYAWFELPQVTPLLWERHPEWREKQVNGEDARNGWRLPLNLFHPEGREAALRFFRQMLLDYEWDGLNLAELCFDTDHGFVNPDKFTPFNREVAQLFKEKYRFDLAELFRSDSPFYWKKNPEARLYLVDWRRTLVRELHLLFLREIEKLKEVKKADWEVIVTTFDSLLHPEIVEQCGVDTRDIIDLMNDFSFVLQVQDPARSWLELPSRYQLYLETYRKVLPDLSRLMFDINVVPWRDIRGTPFPSAVACGQELATLVYWAQQASGRVAIYSEATMLPLDLPLLSFVLGADVTIKKKKDGYLVKSHRPFNLLLNRPDYQAVLNGKNWPLISSSTIAIPAGENYLQLKKAPAFYPAGLAYRFFLDGELIEIEVDGPWYRLSYHSSLPVTFSFYPLQNRLLLDGRAVSLLLDQTNLVLPRGRHQLEIFTELTAVHRIKTVGYFSSLLFFLVGSISVGLLVGGYFYIKLKR